MNLNQSIKPLLLLCFALLLLGCAKEIPVEEQAAEIVIVESTLEVGNGIDVYIHGLRGVIEDQAQSSARVEISTLEDAVILSPIPDRPGHYESPIDFTVFPETSYSLSLIQGDKTIRAETMTPPMMEVLSSSKDYLDAQVQGDLVFLEWSGVNTGSFNEYFYVIELTPLDEDAEAIVRFSEISEASTVLSYVSEVTLSIDDFNFFGPHAISVHAVSKDFENLFAPQTDSGLNGASNIQNGYGYFIGTSVIQGSLEIIR